MMTLPSDFPPYQNTDQVEYVLQLGALSVIPYVAEMVLEHGVVRAILRLLHQVHIQFHPHNQVHY